MAPSTSKTQPTFFPKGIFYSFRVCQLLAATIVGGTNFYFVSQTHHDRFHFFEWFSVLQAAALVTIITVVVTSMLQLRQRLSALLDGGVNIVVSMLWVVGFGLLSEAMGESILETCTWGNWGYRGGVRICKLYKLLFAASLFGVVSTIAAFILDIVVYIRVHPATKYSRANPLLETEDISYQPGGDDFYDAHNVKNIPRPSPVTLPVYDEYTRGRRMEG
ncbi:hypothetical protein K432DRAFT_357315 [Lepidopterella palustris CBS 459.81]|uniref:MARVEL domain-containing protein n=1 Tax=Lepidopterella palustris CBS 459.81 TaxID=1314670 RepID=A0A8E2E6M4_9PEZI|nr:hypothetical protein K432DRAFT_357315 [Lepidopterella palustris CBS 459.81]